MIITTRVVEHGPIRICFVLIKGKCENVSDAKTLRLALEEISGSGVAHFVVDAAAMEKVCSAVLGELVHLATRFRDDGGGIRVVRPDEKFREKLRITRLAGSLGVCGTKEEAIKSFLEGGTNTGGDDETNA